MRISDWSSDVCSSDLFHERDSMEPVSFADLIERAESGLVTVLDVRPEDEFAHSHLPGALNIPLSQLAERLRDLPATGEIVAYYRGPWCVLAFEAVALLRKQGRDRKSTRLNSSH